jgi:hypothetical protein
VSQPQGGRIREAQSVKPTLEVIVHQGSRRYEAEMLVDGGATVNLIPYSVLKKLGRENDELVKINLTLNGMGGHPMEARCVVSMLLTIGRKSLTSAFFIVEVQGNYSVILGHD